MSAQPRTWPSAKVFQPRPFVKYLGGKAALWPEICSAIVDATRGRHVRRYHEPFVGGGAVFLSLAPAPESFPRWSAFLADVNPLLIRAWKGVRDDVEMVLDVYGSYAAHHAEDEYYRVRNLQPSREPGNWTDAEVAAWFIYMNKAGFNGVYRVNCAGDYNVPSGKRKRASVESGVDVLNLRACSRLLQGVDVEEESFETSLTRAVSGDLVYVDPPYLQGAAEMGLDSEESFTGYAVERFGRREHERLAQTLRDLVEQGVYVVASNSAAAGPLYASDLFETRRVSARRNVGATGARRGVAEELLIVGKTP